MYMNANEEMLAGNADADASYLDAYPTYLNTGYADTDADLCIRSMSLCFTYKTPSCSDYFIHVRNIENEQLKNCT